MPKKVLTDLACERIKPPEKGRIEYSDAACAGLALRVSANGHKAWCLYYRLGGKHRRFTIGAFPTIKPAQARRLAAAALELVAQRIDPSAQKRAAREAGPPDQDTFATLARDYVDQHARKNTASGTCKETKRVLDRDVTPKWRNRPISSITRGDVNKLIDAIAMRAPVHANRTLAHVRKVFNWAVAKDRLQASPAFGLQPPTKERTRDRALSDDEVRWFWAACDAIGWPFGPLAKLLLLTAQRRDEVGGMDWSEIDLERKLWTIPRHRAKNDRAHEVQLSDAALEVLRSLPRQGSTVFFNKHRDAPASGFTWAKKRLDAAMLVARGALGQPASAEIPAWIFHDLRRTATTGMARLNIPPHVVDKILNHTSGTIRGVAAVYNRFEYLDERRAALDAWGRYVTELVLSRPNNVIVFSRRDRGLSA